MSPTQCAKQERIHTGERPYKCTAPDCDAAFKEWKDMDRHRMCHDNNRPYACTAEGCEARFVKTNDLTRHFERNHSERGHQRRKKTK